MFKFCVLSFCIYMTSASFIFSQRKFKQENQVDGISITMLIGMGSVVGELGDIFSFKPIYGVNFEKGVSERVNIGVGIVGGNLRGTEEEPHFSEFKSDYFQVETVGTLNISRYFITSYNKNLFELKFYGGMGMIWFHTKVYDSKVGKLLRATSESDSKHTTLFQSVGNGIGEKGIYYTRELAIPFGFKVDYRLNYNVALNFDIGYNWINNDKLDGTTPYSLLNPTVIAGVNSYSETMNDGWMNLSMGIRYTFSFERSKNQRGV